MEIYTSYWAKVSRAPEDILIVKVSNTAPAWFRGRYVELSINVYPDWDLINRYRNGIITYEQFCSEYRDDLLGKTKPEYILSEIEGLAHAYGLDKVALTCYEKTACHRFELARILGLRCGEL